MPFHPPTKENYVNESNLPPPAPAWGQSDLTAPSARQSRANPALAAPYGAQAQASVAPSMAPMMPMAVPPFTLFHSLQMMENVISELGDDIQKLYKRLDPVMGRTFNSEAIQDMDEDETDDSHMVKQMRRQQSRLATLRQLLAQIDNRLQLP